MMFDNESRNRRFGNWMQGWIAGGLIGDALGKIIEWVASIAVLYFIVRYVLPMMCAGGAQ